MVGEAVVPLVNIGPAIYDGLGTVSGAFNDLKWGLGFQVTIDCRTCELEQGCNDGDGSTFVEVAFLVQMEDYVSFLPAFEGVSPSLFGENRLDTRFDFGFGWWGCFENFPINLWGINLGELGNILGNGVPN